MPTIKDEPPEPIATRLAQLRQFLDQELPPRLIDRNLLIATWNIRHFGDLTEKWESGASDDPKRDLGSLRFITEIVSRFDVIALQEVKDNIKALRHMLKALGPDWGFLLTDVTLGDPGNGERMAFLYDTRRVKPSGLAGELVVPAEWLQSESIDPTTMTKQFARTPYAVSFLAGHDTFILVTLHVIYGEATDRTPELAGIARWLADWAEREESWGHNLIALGDFNIDRKDDANYVAFTSTGLRPAPELENAPRTIFKAGQDKFYDQIAWFTGESNVPKLSLEYNRSAGHVDFRPFFPASLQPQALASRISDHFPLWVEFNSKRE